MSSARIYQPAKDPTQSGTARAKAWVLEFDQTAPRETDFTPARVLGNKLAIWGLPA